MLQVKDIGTLCKRRLLGVMIRLGSCCSIEEPTRGWGMVTSPLDLSSPDSSKEMQPREGSDRGDKCSREAAESSDTSNA